MRITVKDTNLQGKALCILQNGDLVFYQRGYLCFSRNGQILKKSRLPLPLWKRLLCQIRLGERLLHAEVRWAAEIRDNTIFLPLDHTFYELDCITGQWSCCSIPVRGKPLFFSKIFGVRGFADSYIIGDYDANRERKPVRLLRRISSEQKWEVCYTFPAGTVRHIHNVIPDAQNSCVYILTGDEDRESGIWCAKNNFAEVTPLVLGRQSYRACQMLKTPEELFYLTDSPSESNCLYRFSEGEPKPLCTIPGTCIYGTLYEDGLLFSTSCEPDAVIPNRIRYWLTSHPGKGISGRQVCVFYLRADGGMEQIAQFEHDGLPLHLLQYGTVTFSNSQDHICYFSTACVKANDYRIFEAVSVKEKENGTTNAGNVDWLSSESKVV